MRNRMHGQRYPVLYADFTHQFRDVRLYRALFNAQGAANLFVRPASHQHSKNFFSRSVNVTRPAGKIRPGDEVTRSMNIDNTRRGAQTEPCFTMRMACTNSSGLAASSTYPLAPRGQRLQDRFVVRARAGHDNPQVRTRRLQARHHVVKVLSGLVAQQTDRYSSEGANWARSWRRVRNPIRYRKARAVQSFAAGRFLTTAI